MRNALIIIGGTAIVIATANLLGASAVQGGQAGGAFLAGAMVWLLFLRDKKKRPQR